MPRIYKRSKVINQSLKSLRYGRAFYIAGVGPYVKMNSVAVLATNSTPQSSPAGTLFSGISATPGTRITPVDNIFLHVQQIR